MQTFICTIHVDQMIDSMNNLLQELMPTEYLIHSDTAADDETGQYRMKYFQSGSAVNEGTGESHLTIEWTNQHGCGGSEDDDPHKTNCHLVLQYMCQDDVSSATGNDDTLRNGKDTDSQEHTPIDDELDESKNDKTNRKDGDVSSDKVIQEQWEWYDKCYNRERNKGLFTADQNLKDNDNGYSSAIYTRQNPNGNRYGYECPEERDHYPYWHPSPWRDISVLVQETTLCSYFQEESFNVKERYECVEYYNAQRTQAKHWSRWNNEKDCLDNNGDWLGFVNYLEKAPDYTSEEECQSHTGSGQRYIWARPYGSIAKECLVALEMPECKQSPWTRDNHLGNDRDGYASNYTWVLPHFPSQKDKRCVFRIRYNISTDDYDPYNTNSSHNHNPQEGVISPVVNNPAVDIGAANVPLRLAINTAQYGRIFQDRTHVFKLTPRPAGIDTKKIYNLNVRGKRGNIVQVYPAVEYDFVPNRLTIEDGDLVHIQWTGSNTHNNGNPGGDGQTGDDGQGTTGTDRNNFVQMNQALENYPLPYENTTLWSSVKVVWIYHEESNVAAKDLAVNMASAGYYRCMKSSICNQHSVETKDALNKLLNNAPASYEGALLEFTKGTYHYMCTRNNDFTNRSQKGYIKVV
uniref:Protein DD3-3-like n=1 Tax=Saccoglossus kowalevskii TaxID=10224 RepID=A0ABM0MR27_SACKO|nr:PREDICTED: protein DD3-3-like [Saccoglossus kowalevskii]